MPALKIATWNVNSLRLRLPAILSWANQNTPDILCLQETKVEDALFPLAELQAQGWHAAYHGQKSYNGVAILSRTPLTEVTMGFANGFHAAPAATDAAQSRLIAGTYQGIRVMNVYIPQGESLESPKFGFKERFYQALRTETQAQLAQHPNLILCGDFNIAADARDIPIDEKKAAKQVMFTPAERAWLTTLQAQTGCTDALRLINQDAGIYSWYDYRQYALRPTHGWRIDYHMVSQSLKPKVVNVEHHMPERAKTQPSDHVPVMLILNL